LRRVFIAVGLALVFAAPAGAQPNVLMIVTDDQRWDTLGYMPTVTAELVGKGVRFDNAFVVNPVCCPSRSSILTGRWSHSTGVWGIDGPYGGFHVFDDSSTLPVWLNEAGYQTAMIGKYLNGYTDGSYVPPGWDQWFAHTTNENAYFDWDASENGSAVSFGSAPEDYNTDVLGTRAANFIRNSGSDPFFLYFAPKAPHLPATPAPRHEGTFAGLEPWRPPSWNEADVSDKPLYVRRAAPIDAAILDSMRQRQLESLLAVDDAVAGILAALEDTGKLHDTLIIFLSDNGFLWGEHRKAHKLVPYEESIRVPLVIRWDALGAQRTSDRFALNVDLAPTIAAAVGIDAPKAEGKSLLPLLTNTATTWRTSFLFEHFAQPWRVPGYCGFHGQHWRYVQYATGEEEFYDRPPIRMNCRACIERCRGRCSWPIASASSARHAARPATSHCRSARSRAPMVRTDFGGPAAVTGFAPGPAPTASRSAAAATILSAAALGSIECGQIRLTGCSDANAGCD
jgi:arylsulfatase A-like enzyme